MSDWISRRHEAGGVVSEAVYSRCERYRYLLTRRWGSGRALLYIMLNPSTATEIANDPTIERCERRARALGFEALLIGNLFAWRETSPALLRKADDPVGPDNAAALDRAVREADEVLAAWGVHGAHLDEGARMERWLRERGVRLRTLGLTRAGHPRHPLYVSYATPLLDWPAGG